MDDKLSKTEQLLNDEIAKSLPEELRYAAMDILATVLERIVGSLTEEDLKELKRIDSEDPNSGKSYDFIVSKVPQLSRIIEEEVNLFKADL